MPGVRGIEPRLYRAAAKALIERLWDSGSGCLSVQVLQEFFVTVTRKVAKPLTVEEADETQCDVLWTEDLNDGQSIRGVRIRNPFIGS